MSVFAPEFLPVLVWVVDGFAVREDAATPVARGDEGKDTEIVFFAREGRLGVGEVAVPFCFFFPQVLIGVWTGAICMD